MRRRNGELHKIREMKREGKLKKRKGMSQRR